MPTSYAGGSVDMTDAPGGDFNLDDLFPNPEEVVTSSASEPTSANPLSEAQPSNTNPDEFFLKTPTGSVYKTRDEAIKGLSHKDELIERLRAQYRTETGRDPLDEKPRAPQAPAVDLNDPLQFWNAQAKAIENKDPVAYQNVLDQWLQNRIAPFIPIVQQGAVSRAVETISAEIPAYRDFRVSNDYSETLNANPVLKNAISAAEDNMQLAGQLPDLYRLTYLVNQGRKAADIARTGAQPQSPAQARPTTSPSTSAPPLQGVRPDLSTPEGRKAIIEAAERKGTADAAWSSFGS